MSMWRCLYFVAVIASLFFVISPPAMILHVKAQELPNNQQTISDNAKVHLELNRLRAEIRKLRAEARSIEALDSFTRLTSTWLGAVGGFLGALLTVAVGILGYFIKSTQDAKLEQDKELTREKHNLELFQNLENRGIKQIAAVSVLIQRLKSIYRRRGDGKKISDAEKLEAPILVKVLISLTKKQGGSRTVSPAMTKYIADNLVEAIGAIIEDKALPTEMKSPLFPFDLQKTCFVNAYWRRIDARGVDFYQADLSKASLREAFLTNAVFYGATMKNIVLYGADLKGANLTGADLADADLREADVRGANLTGADLAGADLREADLRGATFTDVKNVERAQLKSAKYNTDTIAGYMPTVWPENFSIDNRGLIIKNDPV